MTTERRAGMGAGENRMAADISLKGLMASGVPYSLRI
jgi:hypothetical protein